MVDPAIIGGGLDAIRMALQLYLTLIKQSGMTEEERAKFEADERAKFEENQPENLPKPPE